MKLGWDRLRISLRAVLCIVSVVCVSLVVLSSRAKFQYQTVYQIREAGGSVTYSFEVVDPTTSQMGKSNWPQFLIDRLGLDFFHNVVAVDLQRMRVGSDSERAKLANSRMKSEIVSYGEDEVRETLRRMFPTKIKVLTTNEANMLIERFGKLNSCTSLMLNCDEIVDDLTPVSQMNGLELLILTGTDAIDDEEVAKLTRLKKLRTLRISERPKFEVGSLKTDESLRYISQMHTLRDLELYGATVTDQGVEHLKSLTQLTSLNLSAMSKLDETIKKQQSAARNSIMEAMKSQAQSKAAEVADESEVVVAGEVVVDEVPAINGPPRITEKSLAVFAQLPKLKRLTMRGVRISADELDKFEVEHPGIKIVRPTIVQRAVEMPGEMPDGN